MSLSRGELRPKEEIADEIERSRRRLHSAFSQTKDAVVENPAVHAWRGMKDKFVEARYQTRNKARRADITIRNNVYWAIAAVAVAGLIAGLFIPAKRKFIVLREK